MRYEQIEPVSRAVAESAAVSKIAADLVRILIAVGLYEVDAGWAAEFCCRFARHSDALVRGGALLGIAHLARRFRSLDRSRIQPLLEAGLADEDAWVRGQAESALQDIEAFLGWQAIRPNH